MGTGVCYNSTHWKMFYGVKCMKRVIWILLMVGCLCLLIFVAGPMLLGSEKGQQTAWNLCLVNADNPIPDGYEIELSEVPGGQ